MEESKTIREQLEMSVALTRNNIEAYNEILDACNRLISDHTVMSIIGDYYEAKDKRFDVDILLDHYYKFLNFIDNGMMIHSPWASNPIELDRDMCKIFAVAMWIDMDTMPVDFLRILIGRPEVKYVLPMRQGIEKDPEDYHFFDVLHMIFDYINEDGELVTEKIDYPASFNLFGFFNACDYNMTDCYLDRYIKKSYMYNTYYLEKDILYIIKDEFPEKNISIYVKDHLDMPNNIKRLLDIEIEY